MKIGIDARFLDVDAPFTHFILQVVEDLKVQDQSLDITLYAPENLESKRRGLSQEISGQINDLKTKKSFESENFHLMIFFDQHVPFGYKGQYIVILESLKEVFFPKKEWLSRKIYSLKLKRALAHCNSCIVLDNNSALELNETLNIKEDLIKTISAYFPQMPAQEQSPVRLDIKKKHSLTHEYLIYDSGNELHNNFERIIKALKLLRDQGNPIQLLVLCEATTRDLDIRNKVLEYGILDQVHFIGSVSAHDEHSYYSQSKGVIFSSIYESFPFHFHKAIGYQTPIFANNIPNTVLAMGESIHYLDPLSIHKMGDTLRAALLEDSAPNYQDIPSRSMKTAQELADIIQAKN